jgi:hypothetical protein
MTNKEIIDILDFHKIEYAFEESSFDKEKFHINIMFTRNPERLLMLTLNEKEQRTVFTYFLNNERLISHSQETKVLIDDLIELHLNNWEE